MRSAMIMVLLATYAICVPLYKAVNPKGFPVYLAWLLFVGMIWIFVIIPGII